MICRYGHVGRNDIGAIRIAASDTQFQMLEVQRGLYPCCGATFRLPREIGWGNAHKVLLTGERWSADEAVGGP